MQFWTRGYATARGWPTPWAVLQGLPGRKRGFWAQYRHNPAAMLGLALLLGLGAAAALPATFMTRYGPFEIGLGALQPPSAAHWFGTDDLGRDVFSRVAYGARTSLLVGLTVAALSLAIGVVIGGISGYAGGWVDDLLMRLTEFIMVVPRFFLALLVVSLFGPGVDKVVIVLGLTYWPMTARLLRAEVFSLREREFVLSARAVGVPGWAILVRHIVPNALAPVVVQTSMVVGGAILVEAGLSFLGLGDPNAVSWGYMLQGAQGTLRVAWWMSVFPGVAIALAVLGANLTGDGLNDALNPRLRKGVSLPHVA